MWVSIRVGILAGPVPLLVLNFLMIVTISSPVIGSKEEREFVTRGGRYFSKFPSPSYFLSARILSATVTGCRIY
jgi:hypothetical protein